MRRLFLSLGMGLALMLGAPGADAQSPFSPAAVVNDDVITYFDVDQRARILRALGAGPADDQALGRFALDALIEDRLKLQAAERSGIEASEELFQQGLAELAGNAGTTPEDYLARLGSAGVAETAIRDLVVAEVVWRETVRGRFASRVTPGEGEIDAELGLVEASGARPLSYRLREIGLSNTGRGRTAEETLALAERIIAEIRAGADFTDFARQFSEAPTAQAGGDLGTIPADRLPPDAAQALAGTEPGGVAGPLPVPSGLSILQVVEVEVANAATDVNDPELRDRLRRRMRSEQIVRLAEGLLQELRRDAMIERR